MDLSPSPRTRIKICGVKSPEDARAAADAGADAVGLMFVERSPRFISIDMATQIRAELPPRVTPVAVFQDHPRASVLAHGGDWVQLHGSESEDDARLDRHVIKAVSFDLDTIRRWDACPDIAALLIDGPDAGSGKAFDHGELAALMPSIDKPVILAGGLTPENVGAAIRIVRPFAVDVSSGVESSRGVKDAGMMRAFCDAVRAADE